MNCSPSELPELEFQRMAAIRHSERNWSLGWRQESAAYDSILRRLNLLYEKGLLELGLAPEVHFEGVSNLLGLDLHLTREKMRDLFRALEQKKKVLLLLDQFLEQPQGELAVRVGLAEAHPAMSELSIIGITVNLPSGFLARSPLLVRCE